MSVRPELFIDFDAIKACHPLAEYCRELGIDIDRQLNAEGIHARQGGEWIGRFASAVLQRDA